jgi:hypothetical protein
MFATPGPPELPPLHATASSATMAAAMIPAAGLADLRFMAAPFGLIRGAAACPVVLRSR